MEKEKVINILKKAVTLEKGGNLALAKEFDSINSDIKNIDNKVVTLSNSVDTLSEELKKKLEQELVLDFSKEELSEEIAYSVEEKLSPKIDFIEKSIVDNNNQKIKEAIGVISEKHKDALLEVRQLNNKFNKKHEDKIVEVIELIEEVKSIEVKDGKDGKDGSPDTPDQVVDKVNKSSKLIKREKIEGSDKIVTQEELDRAIGILDQRTQFLINKSVSTSSGGSWGSITGTLSDQTDLQNALNAKANVSDLENKLSDTFESVNKNLKAYPYALTYSGDILTQIAYTVPLGTITKTLNYTGDKLTSIVLSGNTPSGIDLTKTLSYTGDVLTSVAYS